MKSNPHKDMVLKRIWLTKCELLTIQNTQDVEVLGFYLLEAIKRGDFI